MRSKRSPREILALLLANRHLVAAVTLSVFLLGMLATMLLPRGYESSAEVSVIDNPALYELYGRSLADAEEDAARIDAIEGEMLSGELASAVADRLETVQGPARLPEPEELVRQIRDGTTVELAERSGGRFVFRISHACGDPALAQRIVTCLGTVYQDRRAAEQKGTAAEELDAARSKVAEIDAKHEAVVEELAAFEKEHAAHRFGEAEDTRTRLATEREKLATVEDEIAEIERRLESIREQVADEQEWITVEREVDNSAAVESIKKEILAAEQVLLGYQLKYTDAHPKVVEQKEKIEQLKARLEEESGKSRKVTRRERNPTWVELRKSEAEVVTDLTVKSEIRAEFAKRVTDLDARMRIYPELKERWDALVERRDSLRSELEKLRTEEQTALLAWQGKVAETATIFDFLERPAFPAQPSSPNRTLIGLVALLVGLAGSVGLVLGRALLDRSFMSSDDVVVTTGVQVLGSISAIETILEREAEQKKRRLAVAAVVGLVVVCAGVVFAQAKFDSEIGSLLRGEATQVEREG